MSKRSIFGGTWKHHPRKWLRIMAFTNDSPVSVSISIFLYFYISISIYISIYICVCVPWSKVGVDVYSRCPHAPAAPVIPILGDGNQSIGKSIAQGFRLNGWYSTIDHETHRYIMVYPEMWLGFKVVWPRLRFSVAMPCPTPTYIDIPTLARPCFSGLVLVMISAGVAKT